METHKQVKVINAFVKYVKQKGEKSLIEDFTREEIEDAIAREIHPQKDVRLYEAMSRRIDQLNRLEEDSKLDKKVKPTKLDVFISHSQQDEQIARRLISLIRAALNLQADLIRCTSVDGYRLPGGVPIDETLKAEIHDSTAFIVIISQTALNPSTSYLSWVQDGELTDR